MIVWMKGASSKDMNGSARKMFRKRELYRVIASKFHPPPLYLTIWRRHHYSKEERITHYYFRSYWLSEMERVRLRWCSTRWSKVVGLWWGSLLRGQRYELVISFRLTSLCFLYFRRSLSLKLDFRLHVMYCRWRGFSKLLEQSRDAYILLTCLLTGLSTDNEQYRSPKAK